MQGEKEGERERNTSASAVPATDKPKIKNRVDRQRNGKRGARTTTCESLDDRLVKCLP